MLIPMAEGRYIAVKEIRPETGYRLWLRFSDGESGTVDVSDIAASHPAFRGWEDEQFFKQVSLDEYGTPFWGEELDLSPDLLYCRLTGLSPADIAPKGEDEALKTLKSRYARSHRTTTEETPMASLSSAPVRSGYAELPEIEHIEPADGNLVVFVRFTDGREGIVDMSPLASMPIFSGWQTGDFADVRIDNGVACWGENAHVSPEWMYENTKTCSQLNFEQDFKTALAAT